jgi:hypothetical protein
MVQAKEKRRRGKRMNAAIEKRLRGWSRSYFFWGWAAFVGWQIWVLFTVPLSLGTGGGNHIMTVYDFQFLVALVIVFGYATLLLTLLGCDWWYTHHDIWTGKRKTK